MSELVVRISADIKKLQDGYSEAAKETQALNDRLVAVAKVSGIGFAATVAAIGLTVAAYREQEVQENKIKALIEATGGAAGYTSGELVKMAEGLQAVTLFGDEVVMEGQAMLLTFTKIGREVFPMAAEQALNMATVLGMDVAGASKILGKALNDPIEGISALSRAGVQFTEEQKKTIEALVRTGDIAKAQAMILGELEKKIGGTARAAAEGGGQFEQLKNVFGDIMEEIGKNFMPLLVSGAKALKEFLIVAKDNQYLIKIASIVLGVGAALTGLTFAAATGGAALVSIRAGMIALQGSMITGRVAAIAFWGAATLGVSLLLVSMPEIIDQFIHFKKVMTGEIKPEGLIQIGNELKRLYDLKERINNQTDVNFGDKKGEQVKKIQDQIDALEALRKKTSEAEEAKKPKEEKPLDNTAAFDEQTKKKLLAAQNEVDLLKLQQQEASKEEIDFAKQKQDLLIREEFAGQEKVKEIRDANLEAVRLEKEELLLQEEEYYRSRAEIIMVAREEQAILDEEMNGINAEAKAALRDSDLAAIRGQILTENEAARELGKEQLTDKININNQKLKDQIKYGKAYAEINAFMQSEEVQGASAAANQLVALTQSKNSTLKGIGKAAALTQVAISTAQGAIGAYAALAPIPFVGPALGFIAAASLTAFGIERASTIMAAADGGLITGGIAGRDSVPAMLMPGEIVVPTKNYEEVVGAVRNQRDGGGNLESGLAVLLVEIRDTLGRLTSGVTINGDYLADDIFIDRMVSKINSGIENRNLQLRTT